MRLPRAAVNAGALVASVGLALAIGAIAMLATGRPVWTTYGAMLAGSVGSLAGLQSSALYAIPIAFTGLAASVAFRAQVWNIGGEGQLWMGAFGAALAALYLPLSAGLHLAAVVLVGMLAGGLWALVPAVLKVWLGVNEVLSSLMLNYVAILWVDFLVYGPWRDPSMSGWPYSAAFPATARLPAFAVHLVAVVAAVVLAVLWRRSRWGFEVRVVGHSPTAARYAGISVARVTLQVLALGGAIAALAGIGEVAGPAARLYHLTAGYGYLGILASWLGRHDPLAVLGAAALYGVLLQGGTTLQIAQVDPSLVAILQAVILLSALAALAITQRSRTLPPQPLAPR